jgi:hypothetical protein
MGHGDPGEIFDGSADGLTDDIFDLARQYGLSGHSGMAEQAL